jgi:hypothetical protein
MLSSYIKLLIVKKGWECESVHTSNKPKPFESHLWNLCGHKVWATASHPTTTTRCTIRDETRTETAISEDRLYRDHSTVLTQGRWADSCHMQQNRNRSSIAEPSLCNTSSFLLETNPKSKVQLTVYLKSSSLTHYKFWYMAKCSSRIRKPRLPLAFITKLRIQRDGLSDESSRLRKLIVNVYCLLESLRALGNSIDYNYNYKTVRRHREFLPFNSR